MGLGSWLKGLFGGGSDKEACVACESTALTTLAEGVYRCDECGYEGGDGLAAWMRAQEKEKLASLDADTLRARALSACEGARLTLLACTGAASGNPEASGENGGWTFTITFGGGTGRGPLDSADEAERARLEAERLAGIASARAEIVGAIPELELLVEQGHTNLQPGLALIQALAQAETASAQDVGNAISTTGAALDR